MADLRGRLEHEGERVGLSPDALERIYEGRHRRDVRRRITAGLAGAAIAIAVFAWLAGNLVRGEPHPQPATESASPPPECPNPEGQACLGELVPGTYTTGVFTPTLTYTVPSGWSNLQDTPGSFLLVPSRGNLPGVNADTSDFIGVYSTICAPNGCDPGTAPGVGLSVPAIARWMAHNPGLTITDRHDVTIGGLKGVVLDVMMSQGWTKGCWYSRGEPIVPLITGVGLASGLDHNIGPGRATRLYLLGNAVGTLAIEVVDVSGGGHLNSYSSVVETMEFGD